MILDWCARYGHSRFSSRMLAIRAVLKSSHSSFGATHQSPILCGPPWYAWYADHPRYSILTDPYSFPASTYIVSRWSSNILIESEKWSTALTYGTFQSDIRKWFSSLQMELMTVLMLSNQTIIDRKSQLERSVHQVSFNSESTAPGIQCRLRGLTTGRRMWWEYEMCKLLVTTRADRGGVSIGTKPTLRIRVREWTVSWVREIRDRHSCIERLSIMVVHSGHLYSHIVRALAILTGWQIVRQLGKAHPALKCAFWYGFITQNIPRRRARFDRG